MFKKKKRERKLKMVKLEFETETTVEIQAGLENVVKGIPSSPGISHGKVIVIKPESPAVADEVVKKENIPAEIKRLEVAVNKVIQEFYFLLDKIKKDAKDVFAVIETNLMILNDKYLLDSIKNRIKSGFSADSSVIQEFEERKKFISRSNDSLLNDRLIELDQIKDRLLSTLMDRSYYYKVAKNSIVVAPSVTPSDLVNFKESGVAAIVTEAGGISSHSSILARSFEIPEVIGVKDATDIIRTNDFVIVDGYSGEVIIRPSKSTINEYELKKAREKEHKEKLGELIKLPSATLDGRKINLLANVDFPDDLENAVVLGAEGIGLVRTECLAIALNGFPDEENQFKVYNEIAERAYPYQVTFRVFDVGSDKYTDRLPKSEENPALGFRGIRYLLHNKEVFCTQIKAILRASRYKNVRLMLPMITNVNEVRSAVQLVEECKTQLESTNIPFDNNMPVGIMIETPAAAIMSERFADFADFFSIGTNDLTQYTLAADRGNELVSNNYDSFHPAVIRLIKMTVDAAKHKNIPVGVCGELASHSGSTMLLIGLGIDELSVSPSVLLELKSRIMKTSYSESVKLAEDTLNCTTFNEVRELLSINC